MQKYVFENDVKVFGIEVKIFPAGIGEAFDELIGETGDKAGARNYYGVSSMDNDGKMICKAVAEEQYEDEARNYNYEESTIEKGEYLFEALKDWRNKTTCIKDIFYAMMNDDQIDKKSPVLNSIRMTKKWIAW